MKIKPHAAFTWSCRTDENAEPERAGWVAWAAPRRSLERFYKGSSVSSELIVYQEGSGSFDGCMEGGRAASPEGLEREGALARTLSRALP